MATKFKQTNILNHNIAEMLAYAIIDTIKSTDRESINKLFKDLQALSKTSKGGRFIKNLLFGSDQAAKQFNNYLISRLYIYVKFESPNRCGIIDFNKQQKLLAAYLGTPLSLEILQEIFKNNADDSNIKYILDAKKFIKSVKKYRYEYDNLSSPGRYGSRNFYGKIEDGREEIEEYESIEKTLEKFPKSTQLKCNQLIRSKYNFIQSFLKLIF